MPNNSLEKVQLNWKNLIYRKAKLPLCIKPLVHASKGL